VCKDSHQMRHELQRSRDHQGADTRKHRSLTVAAPLIRVATLVLVGQADSLPSSNNYHTKCFAKF